MKPTFFIFLFFISGFSFAQNNHIVKTEDGRRVLLKADFTWEYIDLEKPAAVNAVVEASQPLRKDNCNIKAGFEEPKLDSKIQSKLKRGHATIDHVKKKVAKDYKCGVDEVLLLSFSEQKEKAVYHFCANGKKVTYKRVGNSIIKKEKFF